MPDYSTADLIVLGILFAFILFGIGGCLRYCRQMRDVAQEAVDLADATRQEVHDRLDRAGIPGLEHVYPDEADTGSIPLGALVERTPTTVMDVPTPAQQSAPTVPNWDPRPVLDPEVYVRHAARARTADAVEDKPAQPDTATVQAGGQGQ